MLKNKIIALLAVATMMFSFASVASAEKAPLVTDPTFFIDDLGYTEDLGYLYAVGVSYDEYGTSDPFTYKRSGTSALNYKYSGIGFAMANIKLEGFKMTEETMVAKPTLDDVYDLYLNGLLNFTLSGKDLIVPDVSGSLTDKGAVFFVIVSPEAVDLSGVTCSDVTLYIKDYGTTEAKNPTTINEWIYSSDPKMIEDGNADFLAYTKAEVAPPDRAESFVKSIGKFEYAGLTKPFVKATVGTDSRDFYLPNDVVGGTTEVYGIFKYDAKDIAEGTTVTFELWDRGATSAAQSLGSIVAE